ncbi:luciferin 4-monooxygenase-like [Trichoplusia ni]|uniref:Luciferin 4-monooxygenase-like n=1 Tax=Trichoplusia ni TaxID=7111 RepID=A0A7E5VI05_TRINI|nr:luciferin 4-monooxygenase-like [Trichoplusia ni]
MANPGYKHEVLDKFMSEIGSKLVAESGIPSDRYHFGKLILQGLKHDPDFVMQIDGGTGESETNASGLRRCIRCATCFKNLGLKIGDVIIIMGTNNIDQAIPFYAALFEGIIISGIDRTLGVNELKDVFSINKPKLIFCQGEKVQDAKKALELAGGDGRVISYDRSPDTISFSDMLEKYGEDVDVQKYRAADFDSEETIALVVATSGSTGLPKSAILTHKNIAISTTFFGCFGTKFPRVTKSSLILSPIQWLSALLQYLLAPVFQYTRIQSSKELTTDHIFELMNKYQPTYLISSPPMMITLLQESETKPCDFSCFDSILIGGSAVPDHVLPKLRSLAPNTKTVIGYGASEYAGIVLYPFDVPPGSCGKPVAHMQYKLMNVETGEEVKEPHKTGELWVKPPGGFKGYYNNPEETALALTKDGWCKSGDLLYRDENWNYFFVERIKLLLKYRNHQISPVELEAVIHKLPGVMNVAVSGVPDPDCGELPVAFVVPRPGAGLTEKDVEDIVKENLTDSKLLRGGVVFVTSLPALPSSKIDRKKLKQMAVALAKK